MNQKVNIAMYKKIWENMNLNLVNNMIKKEEIKGS